MSYGDLPVDHLTSQIGDLVQRQRDICAATVANLDPASAPALAELLDSVARDLRQLEPLVLTVPLSGPVAAELLRDLADDGGIVTSIPLLVRMACAQYVISLHDYVLDPIRPHIQRIAAAVRAAPLVEGGHVRSRSA